MSAGGDANGRVVLVDDQPERARRLAAAVEAAGYGVVNLTGSRSDATEVVSAPPVDALLLQLDLADGAIELLRDLSARVAGGLPVIALAGEDSRAMRRRALAAGARDFVVSVDDDHEELLLRLGNVLEVRDLQRGLEGHIGDLSGTVARARERIDETRRELAVMELEALHRLALASEYRDDATHEHPQRVARTAGLIATQMRLDDEQVWVLRHAAQLHDIGKIGVPDEILLKPGRLDEDEFELMKTHTVIGWQILSGSSARVLAIAAHIALSHHERFDGSGYPSALAGDAIPLPARIAAVADVFDTLTHVRPYRGAFPIKRAVEEIRRLSRTQFDPRVVGAFELLDHNALLDPVEPEALEAAAV
ncbi:MAG: HD domain-containing phosphohydrolase [Thermoleophilaceae bacterium]